jgi:hypothetical protein
MWRMSVTAKFTREGALESLTFEDVQPGAEMDGVCEWIRLHGIDPADVRTNATITYDPATDEWIFPVMDRPIQIGNETGDVCVSLTRVAVVGGRP